MKWEFVARYMRAVEIWVSIATECYHLLHRIMLQVLKNIDEEWRMPANKQTCGNAVKLNMSVC